MIARISVPVTRAGNDEVGLLSAQSALLGLGLLIASDTVVLGDSPSGQPEGGAGDAVTLEQTTEAKAIFSAQCGWCHGNYGMTADKGPRLAGTQMTEQQVEQRIRNGKPGYMPSFRKFLNDQQITLMARYIKSLEPPPS